MEDDSGHFFFQSPWKNIFLWNFMEVEREALIVSPTIDMDTLRKMQSILIARSQRKLRIQMMFRFTENDLLVKGMDPETLRILALLIQEPNSRIEIRLVPNLSLTAIVLDDRKALLSTGELSSASLQEELNFGQIFMDPDIVAAFKEDLMEIWNRAERQDPDKLMKYMERLKDRIDLRKELVLEDEDKGLSFSDSEFISGGKRIEPLGMDRKEPHLDETRKIIKELLIRARDAAEMDRAQAALFYLEEGLTLDPNNVDLLLEKGKILFEVEEDLDGALACFDRVLDLDEDNRDAWAYSGMCHHKRGELDDALYAYDQATDIDSQHYPVWIKKGIILGSMKGREEDGLKCLEYALSQDPYNEEAWYHKGSILDQRLGRKDEGILAYKTLLRINPKHVKGAFRMGLLSYKKFKDIPKAKKYFNRVIEADPGHLQCWMFMAEIADEVEHDFGAAFEYLESAREHDPSSPNLIHREISLLLKYRKKFKKAVELAGQLMELKPKDPLALYVSGLGKLKLEKDPAGALELLNDSIRSDPGFKPAILSKANLLAEHLDRVQDAVNLLKAAIKKDKKDPELWLELGINYFDFLYDPKEALSCFDMVTRLDIESSDGWYNKGLVLSRGFEKHQEALSCLDEATKLEDDHYLAWFEKGKILFEVYKMPEDALKCLTKALRIEPDDPSTLSLIAAIYRAGNDPIKAERFYEKAMKLEGTTLEPFLGMAELKVGTGDFSGAHSALNGALAIDPKSERVWMMKADTFRKQNELSKSLECYKRVLRINPDNQDALNRKTSVEAQLERMA
ncbi:hypothetical protein B6U90_05160 [Thermoplasmatales archaeon ex4484_6]|nr:MAG: hypothetical protein B6U90_05160 [Thermoplasmatales archaeon ex4484_6]RLF69398.1 MAG: hypothetical protein DRN57_00825 [Thermoplasmata archaeon]